MSAPTVMPRGALLTGAAAVLALFGYAAYFDYQRRTDPNFRKQLKLRSKKQKKEALKRENAAKLAKQEEIVRFLTNELVKDPPSNASPENVQTLFMTYVSEGEKLSAVPGEELNAAVKFYKALTIYPRPGDLLNIYEKTIPPHIHADVILMLEQLPPPNMLDLFKNGKLVRETITDVLEDIE
ncbi:mitochondrial import receptor subunit Tom20p [Monosporozyma servazzii]